MSTASFCMLEKDQKTYEYLSRFFTCRLSGQQMFKLENTIQVEEISSHLALNACQHNDQMEKIHWVTAHGANFRTYLETIKYAISQLCEGKHYASTNEFSWEDFCSLVDRVNCELHENRGKQNKPSVN